MRQSTPSGNAGQSGESVKISIVIVSYNEAEYISQAIDSVFEQQLQYPFEIVIGDDGSTDESPQIIARYEQEHPNVVRSFIVDRGNPTDVIPSARITNVLKRAFSMARGEYICIFSADDKLGEPTRLSRQAAFLDEHKGLAACYTDWCEFWDDGRMEEKSLPVALCRPSYWSGAYVHIACFLFRRSVFDHLLDRMSDDTGLTFSIISTGPIKRVPGMGFMYRQRSGSIMHEVDNLEASILSMMVYQDVLNHGGYKISSCSRYAGYLRYIFSHRDELGGERYKKYLASCATLPHDIVGDLVNASPLGTAKFAVWVGVSLAMNKLFGVVRRADSFAHRKLNSGK